MEKSQKRMGRRRLNINVDKLFQRILPLAGALPAFRIQNKKSNKFADEMFEAAYNNNIAEIKTYLDLGGDPNSTNMVNDEKISLIILAAIKGSIDMTDLLFMYGVDPNPKGVFMNRSALYEAVSKGFGKEDAENLYIVKKLIKKGADVNAQDTRGETILMRATAGAHTKFVEYLLSAGANPFLKDKDGKMAYNYCDSQFHEEIKKKLKAYETIWKMRKTILKLDEKFGSDAPKFIRSLKQAVKNCNPEKVKEIFVGL